MLLSLALFSMGNALASEVPEIHKPDIQNPIIDCPGTPFTICDTTTNDTELWNESYWWDNGNQSHDLCEGYSNICITAIDSCSGGNLAIKYQLFLDLDGDGTTETVVNSTALGAGGLGWNNVLYDNVGGVGQPRQFDGRVVDADQKWGFALEETIDGATKTACVKFNTAQSPNTFETPQLPHGSHRIKWIVTDGCGNETICEYAIIVKDCKPPAVVCKASLTLSLPPTNIIYISTSDLLQHSEDNCTQAPQIKYSVRKCGADTGFPVDYDDNPIASVYYTCCEPGLQCTELWAMDLAGNVAHCQTSVFIIDNAGNCNCNSVTVSGAVKTELNVGISEVFINIFGLLTMAPPFNYFSISNNNGVYALNNVVPTLSDFTIAPFKDDNPLNGVTTYDLVLISKHILGIEPLGSPYKIIAADANKSNSITTFDIIELRKLILGFYQELPSNTSWRFVDHAYAFPNPLNPFSAVFPETIFIQDVTADQLNKGFVGVKIGDVNNSVVANGFVQADDRTNGTMLLDVDDRTVKAGEVFDVTFTTDQPTLGYQMTLNLNGLEVSDIVSDDKVTENNFGVFGDALTVSIDGSETFTVKFRATKSGKLSQMLGVSSRITKAEGYSAASGRKEVALRYGRKTIAGVGFELYQNQPNPFVTKTVISFHLPEATSATLTVYDVAGRLIYTQKGDFEKGYNTFAIDRQLVGNTGALWYRVETSTDSATKTMIQSK